MNIFKVLAAGRTQSDPQFKEGDHDSDEFKEAYFDNLNTLAEEFQYRMQTTASRGAAVTYVYGVGPLGRQVGLRGSQLSFPLTFGDNAQAQKTIRRQLDRKRFDDYAINNRNFFNAETRRLLQLEEVKVEGQIVDGAVSTLRYRVSSK